MGEFECGDCGHLLSSGERVTKFCPICGGRIRYMDGFTRSTLNRMEQYERDGEDKYPPVNQGQTNY